MHVAGRHVMVRIVRFSTSKGKSCNVNACNGKASEQNVMIRHFIVWHVMREMHVWADMPGQGIIGQYT
jgi:hypothetical protein